MVCNMIQSLFESFWDLVMNLLSSQYLILGKPWSTWGSRTKWIYRASWWSGATCEYCITAMLNKLNSRCCRLLVVSSACISLLIFKPVFLYVSKEVKCSTQFYKCGFVEFLFSKRNIEFWQTVLLLSPALFSLKNKTTQSWKEGKPELKTLWGHETNWPFSSLLNWYRL